MITIFCDFCLFPANKVSVFLKHQCYDHFFQKVTDAIFFAKFFGKEAICPRSINCGGAATLYVVLFSIKTRVIVIESDTARGAVLFWWHWEWESSKKNCLADSPIVLAPPESPPQTCHPGKVRSGTIVITTVWQIVSTPKKGEKKTSFCLFCCRLPAACTFKTVITLHRAHQRSFAPRGRPCAALWE
jgi:hypothetical protein